MTRTKQTKSKQTSETMQEAIRVRTFLDGGSIPNFICDAVIDAIREASRRTGAPMPEVHPKQGYDLEALAYLFEVASTIDLRAPGFAATPLQVLAAHLAAVMAHPETPVTLHNALGRTLTEMANAIDFAAADMIERTLDAFKRQESQEEGGSEDDKQN